MDKQEILKNFGLKLKIYRTAKNLSQDDLSAETGFSKPYISNVENGKHNISLVNAVQLAEFFGKSINDMLNGDI